MFLSRRLFPKPRVVNCAVDQKYFFNYYEVASDHLVDDASEFAPRKPETSGQTAMNQPTDLELA